MDNRLTKSERLHSFGAIRRLFNEGRSGFVYPFRYIVYTECDERMSAAVLFSTPKRYHKRANRRNLLRRRMREAYRLNKSLLTECGRNLRVEIAFIYSAREMLGYETIENGIKRIIQTVVGDM